MSCDVILWLCGTVEMGLLARVARQAVTGIDGTASSLAAH